MTIKLAFTAFVGFIVFAFGGGLLWTNGFSHAGTVSMTIGGISALFMLGCILYDVWVG